MHFCVNSCYFFFLTSYIVYLGPFSFLGEPGQRFVNFVYPFKEPTLGFIDIFSYYVLISVLFTLSLIFIISFLLLTLGFVCALFSNSFRWWVRLFKQDFTCFLKKVCIAMILPLRTDFAASHRVYMVVVSLSFVSRYF